MSRTPLLSATLPRPPRIGARTTHTPGSLMGGVSRRACALLVALMLSAIVGKVAASVMLASSVVALSVIAFLVGGAGLVRVLARRDDPPRLALATNIAMTFCVVPYFAISLSALSLPAQFWERPEAPLLVQCCIVVGTILIWVIGSLLGWGLSQPSVMRQRGLYLGVRLGAFAVGAVCLGAVIRSARLPDPDEYPHRLPVIGILPPAGMPSTANVWSMVATVRDGAIYQAALGELSVRVEAGTGSNVLQLGDRTAPFPRRDPEGALTGGMRTVSIRMGVPLVLREDVARAVIVVDDGARSSLILARGRSERPRIFGRNDLNMLPMSAQELRASVAPPKSWTALAIGGVATAIAIALVIERRRIRWASNCEAEIEALGELTAAWNAYAFALLMATSAPLMAALACGLVTS